MNQKLLKEIIKNLQSKVACPVCGHRFDRREIKFKGSMDKTYFFEFGCPMCHTVLFAKVLVNKTPHKQDKPSIQSAQLKDISSLDEEKAERKKLKTDDVIKFHKELEEFDGDFRKFFYN